MKFINFIYHKKKLELFILVLLIFFMSGCGFIFQLSGQLIAEARNKERKRAAERAKQSPPQPAISAPDLVVERFTINDVTTTNFTTTAGDNIALRLAIRNLGNDTSTSFEVKYYQSLNNILFTNQIEKFIKAFSPTPPSTINIIEDISINIPETPSPIYYRACVDSVKPLETNSTNNCSSVVRVDIKDRADSPTVTP